MIIENDIGHKTLVIFDEDGKIKSFKQIIEVEDE